MKQHLDPMPLYYVSSLVHIDLRKVRDSLYSVHSRGGTQYKNYYTAKFSQLNELPTNPSRKMLTRTMTCRQIFDNLSQRLHLHYQHRTSSIKHTTKASPRTTILVPHAFHNRRELV